MIELEAEEVVAEPVEEVTEPVTEPVEGAEAAPVDNDKLVADFTQAIGGIPEGASIELVEGKPSLTMKINGVPTTRTLEEIVRTYSMDTAAEGKLETVKGREKELKDLEEQTKTFINDILSDPKKYHEYRRLAGIPADADEAYAQEVLEKALLRSEMTEEQLELEKLRADKKAWEEKDKKDQAVRLSAEENAKMVKLQEEYSGGIINALSTKGYTGEQTKLDIMQNALYYMMVAKHNNVDVTPDQAVDRAEGDLKKYVYSMFGKMSDDQIRKMMPENVVKAVRMGSDETAGLKVTPTSNSLKSGEVPIEKKKDLEESMNNYFKNL